MSFSVVDLVVVMIAVIAALVLTPALLSYLRNRRTGGRGIAQHSRLTCPKCRGVFDYDWIPGMSMTAVRLAGYRYMACPLCHRWSSFDVWGSVPPPVALAP